MFPKSSKKFLRKRGEHSYCIVLSPAIFCLYGTKMRLRKRERPTDLFKKHGEMDRNAISIVIWKLLLHHCPEISFIFSLVIVDTAPVAGRPFFFWNSVTPARVYEPK